MSILSSCCLLRHPIAWLELYPDFTRATNAQEPNLDVTTPQFVVHPDPPQSLLNPLGLS